MIDPQQAIDCLVAIVKAWEDSDLWKSVGSGPILEAIGDAQELLASGDLLECPE